MYVTCLSESLHPGHFKIFLPLFFCYSAVRLVVPSLFATRIQCCTLNCHDKRLNLESQSESTQTKFIPRVSSYPPFTISHVWLTRSNMGSFFLVTLALPHTSLPHYPPLPVPYPLYSPLPCPSPPPPPPHPSSNSLPRTNPGGLSHRWVWAGLMSAWHCLKCLALPPWRFALTFAHSGSLFFFFFLIWWYISEVQPIKGQNGGCWLV